jgi:hypothetical protein
MMLQNVALMAQALGLGGFPNFAEHEYSWFEALGFRMGQMPAGKYLGAKYIVKGLMAALGRNPPVQYALGLEHDGTVLMGSYCPPYYPDMAAAVRAVIECNCDYIYRRYGRFPTYMPPFRTVLGFQACHLDTEFYRHYYRPDALSETEREHMKNWHGAITEDY